MSIGQGLSLNQSTSLVMTPKLQQALKLLQMSHMELGEFVEQELVENPFLEREGESRTDEDDNYREDADSDEASSGDESLSLSEDGIDLTDLPIDDFENVWSASDSLTDWKSPKSEEFEAGSIDQTAKKKVSLRDHLIPQISLDIRDPAKRMAALYMMDQLDDAGYFKEDLNEVAATLGCDTTLLEETLSQLQQCDPVGIFSTSLGQCLENQLKDRRLYRTCYQPILNNLEMLAKHDYKKLCKMCGVDLEQLRKMIKVIRSLNPKPAERFREYEVTIVRPDVFVRMLPNTRTWHVELNTELLPRVLANEAYFKQVDTKVRDGEEKSYLRTKFSSASWIVKAMNQRATTILKVSTEIVKQQDAFFKHGIKYLKPQTMKDIAEAIEMHESTISRVTTNKYIATPRGVFELKYFFTSSVQNSSEYADSHSSETVRHRIKRLVDAETVSTVMSDDRLVEELEKEGIRVARRTVAKYRDMMKIPSSSQRKRIKKAELMR